MWMIRVQGSSFLGVFDHDPDLAQEGRSPPQAAGECPCIVGPGLDLATRSPTTSARAPRRSEAVPVHSVRMVIRARTALATGSASITPSTASSRLPQYADQKVPAGHSAVSQAVAHSAKSAMRGGRSNLVCGSILRPITTASSRTPRMRGRSALNSSQNSASNSA